MNSDNVPSVQQAIKNGPSKWDLMLALFDRKHPSPRSVEFIFRGSDHTLVVIDELGIEDGSGDSWLFKGHIIGWKFSDQSRMQAMLHRDYRDRQVTGHYRTDTRKGHIYLPV